MTPGRRHLGHAELQVRLPQINVKNIENARELAHFNVPEHKRGLGNGSRLLAKVCREADGASKALILTVRPYDGAERSTEQLEAWYGRYGFAAFQREPEVMMIRLPKGVVQ